MRVQQIKQIQIGSIPELKLKPHAEGSVAERLVCGSSRRSITVSGLTSMLTFVLVLGESRRDEIR